MLLNCIDLKNNGTERLFVKSMSMDTVVVLLGHNNKIPRNTTIIRGGRKIEIGDFYSRLGENLTRAVIGWYAMQIENFYLIYLCLRN